MPVDSFEDMRDLVNQHMGYHGRTPVAIKLFSHAVKKYYDASLVWPCNGQCFGIGHAGRAVGQAHPDGAYPSRTGIPYAPVDAHSDAREHLRNQRPDAQRNTLVGFDTD